MNINGRLLISALKSRVYALGLRVSSYTVLSCALVACGDDEPEHDAYFGTVTPETVVVTGDCAGDPVMSQAGMMGSMDMSSSSGELAGESAGDLIAGADPMDCTAKLTPSGESRDGIAMGCDEGCALLADCAIREGECPGLTSCDSAGVVDMCLAICSDQLLAVFDTLDGCEAVVSLATRGLGEPFASACQGD